jgi:hypothetical protein
MKIPGSRHGLRYEVRVKGQLSEAFAVELAEAEISDLTTGIVFALPDEAALHGLLRRIEALGLELVSVQPVD